MISSIAALLILASSTQPLDLLKEVRAHYRALTAFSMQIDHHGSSGLFPGEFSQALRWRKGGHFDLLVTKKNPDANDRKAPDYFADGKAVLSVFEDGRRDTSPLTIDPNTSPGWEVSGGLIMGWLEGTPASKLFFDPPSGMNIVWSYGPRAVWQKQKVKEILGTMKSRQGSASISLFVDEATKTLVGFDYSAGSQKGFALYRDQKANPPLPASVGSPAAK